MNNDRPSRQRKTASGGLQKKRITITPSRKERRQQMNLLPKYTEDKQTKIIQNIKKLVKKSANDRQLDTAFENTRHIQDKAKRATLRRDIAKRRLALKRKDHADLRKKWKEATQQVRKLIKQKKDANLQEQQQLKKQINEEMTKIRAEKRLQDINKIASQYQPKPSASQKKPPTLLNDDRFSGLTREAYELGGCTTLRDFYQEIRSIQSKNDADVIFRFVDSKHNSRFVTMKCGDMTTYNAFKSFINKMFHREGAQEFGSDRLENGVQLDMDYFGLVYGQLFGNYGKCSSIMFSTIEQPKDSKLPCFLFAVQQIDPDLYNHIIKDKTAKQIAKEFKDYTYTDAIKFGEEHGIQIFSDFPETMELTNEKIQIGRNIYKKAFIAKQNLTITSETRAILFNNQHYERIIGYKHVCVDNKGNLCNDTGKIIMRRSVMLQLLKNVKTTQNGEQAQLVPTTFAVQITSFDFETLFDPKRCGLLFPMSAQFKIDETVYVYHGEDCVKKFLKKVLSESKDKLIVFNGYNSSRFDNFPLLDAALELDVLDSVFFQGNSILNMKMNGRHTVFDTCRFTLCSLKQAGEDFQLTTSKIQLNEDISFKNIQNYYLLHGELSTFFHEANCQVGNDKLTGGLDFQAPANFSNLDQYIPCKCPKYTNFVKYGICDVLSLSELYAKLKEIIEPLIKNEGRQMFDYKTIGSLIYSLFQKDLREDDIRLPLLQLADYKKTRSGLVAGRTQCYKGVYFDLKKDKKYHVIDVKSLYPYVMLERLFPCGDIIHGSYQECVQKGLIGSFMVKFNQRNCRKNILPRRVEGAELDWNYKDTIEAFISTVDIQDLIAFGAEIEEIGEGYYFTEKIEGAKLFKCMSYFKQIKQQQDQFKKDKNPQFNPALRQMAKIFLNSLSGKVIERLHMTQYKMVKSQKQYNAILKKDEKPNLMYTAGQNIALLSYEISEEDALRDGNRPIYLGCLIYAYARSHMLRSVLWEYDVIYQDTDSAVLEDSEFKRFLADHPELIGEEFGQFEIEKYSGEINAIATLAPKNYFMFAPSADQGLAKKGFKGINLRENGDRLLNKEDLYRLGFKIRKDGSVQAPKNLSEEQHIMIMIELWNTYEDKQLANIEVLQEFLDQQQQKKSSYIICSSLQKVVKDIGSKNGGNIYQRYIIKQISSQ